jgi:hypothetical protein
MYMQGEEVWVNVSRGSTLFANLQIHRPTWRQDVPQSDFHRVCQQIQMFRVTPCFITTAIGVGLDLWQSAAQIRTT